MLPAKEAAPEPVEAWAEEVKGWWEVYWRSDVAEVASEVDLPAISRLFGMYDSYQRALEVVQKAIVVKGSTGQIRVNPLADYAFKLSGQILRLEEELGLTPLSRQRLGIAVAEKYRSLDELNRSLSQAVGGDEQDPRLAVV